MSVNSRIFWRHGREGNVLIALDEAADAPGVLLREKSLGNDREQIDVEADRADGEQQDQELVAQHPAQRES